MPEDSGNVTDTRLESLSKLPISITEMLPTLPPTLVHSLLPWIQQTRVTDHNILTPGFNDSTRALLGSRPQRSMISVTAMMLPHKFLFCSLKIACSKVTGHCAPLLWAGISWCAMDLDWGISQCTNPGLIKERLLNVNECRRCSLSIRSCYTTIRNGFMDFFLWPSCYRFNVPDASRH